MTDQIWKRHEIESPCVKTCTIHPDARLCVGCLRSIDEITQWSRMSHDQRSQIMAELPQRNTLLAKRRGGRSARVGRD